MTTATKSNGSKSVETDAKTMLAAADKEAKRAHLPDEQPELDYAPCKTVAQAMLIMCGERVDHSEAVKGLCATGKVILQVGTERIDFGVMTVETLQILPDAMAFCYECEMSSEDILAIALDAKKAWCLGFKTTLAADKAVADKAKNQSKIDKQKTMLAKLKVRKS